MTTGSDSPADTVAAAFPPIGSKGLFSLKSAGLVLLVAGLFFTVFCLHDFDVFTKDFATTGARAFRYNFLRVAFLFYFVWNLAGLGWLALGLLRRRGLAFRLAGQDRLLLSFFLGAALLTLVMLPLGLLNLYYPATALALSVPVLVFSYPQLCVELAAGAGLARRVFWPEKGWSLDWFVRAALSGALLLLAGVMLISRCLYPGEASNDAYEIYWPYQRLVILSHGLWPNDVWYMFYAFKGAGLNFYAMLLSDLVACQSVTFCLLLAGVLAAYSIVKRIGNQTLFALLAGVITLASFLFTNPAWGAFQSHHIGAGVWVACMVWMAVLTVDRSPGEYWAWFSLWSILAAAAAVYFPLFIPVFVFPLLVSMALGHAAVRNFRIARGYLLVMVCACITLAGLMLLNYAIGGMFLENPLRLMWQTTDQQNFSRWCSPYYAMYILEGSKPGTGGVSFSALFSHTLESWQILFRVQSLGLLWLHPVVPSIFVVLLVLMLAGRNTVLPSSLARWQCIVPLLMPLVGGVLAADSGHPASVYRNYGLFCFFLPAVFCLLWQTMFEVFFTRRAGSVLAAIFCFIAAGERVIGALQGASVRRLTDAPSRWGDYFGFFSGRLSFQDALSLGDGLWPAALAAKSVVGAEKQIYSFSHPPYNGSYLFPGSGLLTEPSRASFARDWHVIAFGDPESAATSLKEQGINYFLIDFNLPFFGAIPYSPLFEPFQFADRFDLVWAEGSACLVTWRGQGKQRVPAAIVDALYKRVQLNRSQPDMHPDGVMGRLYDNMKIIFDYNQGRAYPVERPANLPHVSGWQ